MKKKILFYGAGNIARAIRSVIEHGNDAEIEMWDKDPLKVNNQKKLEEVVRWADVIFLCVNSWVIREAMSVIADDLQEHTVVVFVSKGIESDSAKSLDELAHDVLPQKQHFGLLSGPMLAKEMQEGKGASAVFAADSEEALLRVTSLLAHPLFHVEYSFDLSGVALCGVLKNVYAIGLGIIDGLNWGNNMKGWYVVETIKEMGSIIVRLGGKRETVLGPAGLGDLIATGFSAHSRNHTLGREMATLGSYTEKSEGFVSLGPLLRKLDNKIGDYQILRALSSVVLGYASAKDAFEDLLPKID